MPGFNQQTDSPDDITVMSADNACWDGSDRNEIMSTDGQLWIGSTMAPHVRLGTLTAGAGITITPGSGTIEIASAGGGVSVDSFAMQAGILTVVPTDPGGLVTFNGSSVAAGITPVQTRGTTPNTMQLEVQIASPIAATDATRIGLAAFDSAAFDVDANGFVQLNGGGIATTAFDVQANTAPGTDPVVPTAAGVVTVNGAAVGAHSVPIETRSRAANAYNIEVQYSSAAAATDATQSGIAHFESAQFTVDANGFVAMVGGANLPAIQTLTGDDGTAVGPDANGDIDINGFIVANATNAKPLFFDNEAVNVLRAELQVATERTGAPANSNDAGVCSFDDTDFTVDDNGFVQLAGGGAGQTITGDLGGALPPTAGNWNIFGRSGSITSGALSTLTVRSPDYGDVGGSGTSTLNTGEFVTATATRTLPATAGLEDGDLVEYVATTANVLTLTANTNQRIRLGNVQSAVAGTAVSTAIGDSMSLRFRASDQIWYATSSVGIWVIT